MKVTVKKKSAPLPLVISTEFIKLEAAMKLSGIMESGGQGAWALSPRSPTSRRATPWRTCCARPMRT